MIRNGGTEAWVRAMVAGSDGPKVEVGVGLPLARRIVERNGGRCSAESEAGRGATFSFTLGACSGRPV